MNPNPIPRGRSGRSLASLIQLLAGAGALLASVFVRGQGLEFEQPNPTPGGVSPFPVITSIQESPAKDSVLIKWIGVQGPYQIQHKDAVAGATWTDVGTPGDVKELTHAKTGAAGFFGCWVRRRRTKARPPVRSVTGRFIRVGATPPTRMPSNF